MRTVIGIDLGGTSIKAGLVDDTGRLLRKNSMPTRVACSQETIVCDMAQLACQLLQEENLSLGDVVAVGVGAPGTPDEAGGTLIYANNLPFQDVPIRAILKEALGLPVFVDNDANVAALAESMVGATQKARHSVLITLGTGVGSGVIIDRKIYRGFNQAASEIGHILIQADGEPCTCGRRGCFEVYASATALIRETRRAAEANPQSLLQGLIDENKGLVDGRTAFEAMRAGDPVASQVVDVYTTMIAEGLASVINVLMPDMIAIGGGISHEGDALLIPVREKTIPKAYLGHGVAKPQLVLATLGNDAGMIGAALMALGHLDQGRGA